MHRLLRVTTTLLLLCCITEQSAFAASKRRCTIKQIVGSVKIRRGTSTKWSDARPRMPLKESDAIRTFMESEAELETSEGSIIKVGENTTIELNQMLGDERAQNTTVKILNGAVLANVKKLVSTKSTFDFETPTATAAIRGTVVGLEVTKEVTKVRVYEGKVWVAPRGNKNGKEIQPNEMGVVKKGVDQVAVEKLDPAAPAVLSVLKPDSASGTDSTAASDSSAAADSSIAVDTTSLVEENAPLKVVLTSPGEGAPFPTSAQIQVSGTVAPTGASITINGNSVSPSSAGAFQTTLTTPVNSGELSIVIAAEHNGSTKSIVRTVNIQSGRLLFSVVTPVDGQEFKKPLVPVSGSVTPGAEVNVQSIKLPVTANGTFVGQIPIANEAGTYALEFEATVDGASQQITRNITYKPEYRFILNTPGDRQTVSTTMFPVKGEVLPANSEVTVMGRNLPVTSTGQFNGYLTIPDEEGEVFLEFEITASGLTKTETRKIIYTRPPDTYRPQISASVAKSCWSVTVFDRTVDEEITLWNEVDGVKESRSMRPNESTCIPFEEGIHSYAVYAEDKSGNVSTTETLLKYAYLSGATWLIKMRRPAGSAVLDLPPASPAGEQAIYTVELSIEKLPDDNMSLIHEVIITNRTNGKKVYVRTFTDNFITADIELARNRTNLLQIDARDVNSVLKSQVVQIIVR